MEEPPAGRGLTLTPRITFVTLACRDIERMAPDPESNVWDVVWADGTTIDDRGGLVFP